ncbi:MAG: YIP1 family protein [Firmicutes bacterium]|nr:YIP1 family protein [Bacillota bacterium]
MDMQKPTGEEIKHPENKEGNLNLWQRISGVLWGGPGKTFADIAARPGVTAMVLLLLSVSFLLALAILPKIKEFTLWTIQNEPNAVNMPPEAMSMATTLTVVVTLLGSVLAPLILWLIMAGLLKLYNAFAGEKAPFQTLFAVTVYAYLPVMLGSIIKTALIMTSPAQNFQKISTSLALLLPGDQMDRLYMVLMQVDPFFIWGVVLLAVGSSVVMKVAPVKTGAYVGALWLVYVLGVGLLTPLSPAGI